MSVVKVVPQAFADAPAPRAGTTPMTRLGIQMLPDEEIYWEGTFKAFSKVNLSLYERLVYKVMTCFYYKGKACCGCLTLNKPTYTWDRHVLLTSKRLVVQEKEDYEEPGQKFLCYWLCCCCLSEVETKEDRMQEDFVQVSDIKDFKVEAIKTSVNYTCCFVCRETLDSKDTSRVILHVVRPPGVSKASFGVWECDKELKTYTGKVEIEGHISREDLGDFMYALRRVAQSNVAAEKAYNGIAAIEKP